MIYLTGASGRLGSAVLKRVNCIPLVRRSVGLRNEIVTSYDVEELTRIFRDAKAVLHIAGSMKFNDKKSLWEGNVKITENVVNALPSNAKIIFASTIAVYGSNPPYMANEETEINPDNEYARTKAKAEEIVKSHRRHVILRIGTIYGVQYEEYLKMISLINRGIVPIIGSGKNRIPFVHIDDVANCFVESLRREVEGVYVVCGKSERLRDIMIFTARLLRKRFFILRIPKNLARCLAKPLGLEEHVKVLTSDRVFDISKAMKELGFRPRDIWDGIREIVNYWRSRNER
jgi:nucleoside-diphosphate-sugar epimerase